MKKYGICLFLILCISAACLGIGYSAADYWKSDESGGSGAETVTETEILEQEAVNRELVSHRHETVNAYYLVSENGFLMVFPKDQEAACLYTHIPVMEMPPAEQERLREGIWFPSMSELFQYLESCTS